MSIYQALETRLRTAESKIESLETIAIREILELKKVVTTMYTLVLTLSNAQIGSIRPPDDSKHKIVVEAVAKQGPALDEMAGKLAMMTDKGQIRRVLDDYYEQKAFITFLSIRKNIRRLFWPAMLTALSLAGKFGWEIIKEHWK